MHIRLSFPPPIPTFPLTTPKSYYERELDNRDAAQYKVSRPPRPLLNGRIHSNRRAPRHHALETLLVPLLHEYKQASNPSLLSNGRRRQPGHRGLGGLCLTPDTGHPQALASVISSEESESKGGPPASQHPPSFPRSKLYEESTQSSRTNGPDYNPCDWNP
jgi:hypothetical protein